MLREMVQRWAGSQLVGPASSVTGGALGQYAAPVKNPERRGREINRQLPGRARTATPCQSRRH